MTDDTEQEGERRKEMWPKKRSKDVLQALRIATLAVASMTLNRRIERDGSPREVRLCAVFGRNRAQFTRL